MRGRAGAHFADKEKALGPFVVSETVVTPGKSVGTFHLVSEKSDRVREGIGAGQRLAITGKAGKQTKIVVVTIYDTFPTMAVFDVQYTDLGAANLSITKWINNAYTINVQSKASTPAFWSYQRGSYVKRPNWVLPLNASFSQQNYLGLNASDYGGGTPVVDVWRRDVGIAVGHVEMAPRLVSLPVAMRDSGRATVAVEFKHQYVLKPGATLRTLRTFVAVHQGDYFQALRDYRNVMV